MEGASAARRSRGGQTASDCRVSRGRITHPRANVAFICFTEGVEIPWPIPLLNNRGRISESDKNQIGEQSSGPSVAVEERVNLFKPRVPARHRLGNGRIIVRNRFDFSNPVKHQSGYFWVVRRSHTSGERLDVVPAPASRRFVIERLRVRSYLPHLCHRH